MDKVLFVNSTQPQCGVFQYGKRVSEALVISDRYNFVYVECSSMDDYLASIRVHSPIVVIYNYHPLTMAWFNGTRVGKEKHFQIHHEGSHHENLKPDCFLYADSVHEESLSIRTIPRPLLGYSGETIKPEIPTVGSFGFGFGNKNYGLIARMVNEQFDEAILRLHIPRAYFGDRDGEATSQIIPGITTEITKPDIKLVLTHDFKTDNEILEFLASNSINVFVYDQMNGRGLSSVIDYALSVDTPLGINKSYMFRHIYDTLIDTQEHTLPEIISRGTDIVRQKRKIWTGGILLNKIENIVHEHTLR